MGVRFAESIEKTEFFGRFLAKFRITFFKKMDNMRKNEGPEFEYTVIHPNNMEYAYMCTPDDTDIECNSLEAAESWIKNY